MKWPQNTNTGQQGEAVDRARAYLDSWAKNEEENRKMALEVIFTDGSHKHVHYYPEAYQWQKATERMVIILGEDGKLLGSYYTDWLVCIRGVPEKASPATDSEVSHGG